jgi:hypothetical protein
VPLGARRVTQKDILNLIFTSSAVHFCTEGAEIGGELAGPWGAVGGCVANAAAEIAIVESIRHKYEVEP